MKGKVCVITGANSGIGYETALALAKKRAELLIISKDEQKVGRTVENLKKETKNNRIDGLCIDLSVQREIREGAKKILSQKPVIDVLINNAGTWYSNLTYTEENIEMQFAVNHLAYFYLTHLLLPAVAKSSDPRIINVGSDSHFSGKLHFNDINLIKKYHGLRAYSQSKLGNLFFTYEFDRRKPLDKICINCLQPGLVKTNIGLKHTVALHGLAWKLRRLRGVSPAEGAETSIYLASSDEVKGVSGKYWEKCRIKKSSKRSYVREDAQRLWLLSERLCDIDDYFHKIEVPG
jgi:NAD(P)-dependent dehydrogenase (short-subunit alcohol dehydrogenase family)